jgi:hypothetical protein
VDRAKNRRAAHPKDRVDAIRSLGALRNAQEVRDLRVVEDLPAIATAKDDSLFVRMEALKSLAELQYNLLATDGCAKGRYTMAFISMLKDGQEEELLRATAAKVFKRTREAGGVQAGHGAACLPRRFALRRRQVVAQLLAARLGLGLHFRARHGLALPIRPAGLVGHPRRVWASLAAQVPRHAGGLQRLTWASAHGVAAGGHVPFAEVCLVDLRQTEVERHAPLGELSAQTEPIVCQGLSLPKRGGRRSVWRLLCENLTEGNHRHRCCHSQLCEPHGVTPFLYLGLAPKRREQNDPVALLPGWLSAGWGEGCLSRWLLVQDQLPIPGHAQAVQLATV